VRSASLVIKLDSAAVPQWTSAGVKVQRQLVQSFLDRLGRSYPKSVRSITITDSSGLVYAVGDKSGRGAAAIKLYK
jgi:hypothetical protein